MAERAYYQLNLIISPVPCGGTLTPADSNLLAADSVLVFPHFILSTVDCTKSYAGRFLMLVNCILTSVDCILMLADCILTPFDYTCYESPN